MSVADVSDPIGELAMSRSDAMNIPGALQVAICLCGEVKTGTRRPDVPLSPRLLILSRAQCRGAICGQS